MSTRSRSAKAAKATKQIFADPSVTERRIRDMQRQKRKEKEEIDVLRKQVEDCNQRLTSLTNVLLLQSASPVKDTGSYVPYESFVEKPISKTSFKVTPPRPRSLQRSASSSKSKRLSRSPSKISKAKTTDGEMKSILNLSPSQFNEYVLHRLQQLQSNKSLETISNSRK